jgi:hypothetical protein
MANLAISILSQAFNNTRSCLIFHADQERDNVSDTGYNWRKVFWGGGVEEEVWNYKVKYSKVRGRKEKSDVRAGGGGREGKLKLKVCVTKV